MARGLAHALAGLGAMLLGLELLLRLLPVSTATMTGYHHDPDVLTYPSGHRWTVSTGWDLRNVQHLRANNWGFATGRDFFPDAQAVALVGDSYVEASMLDEAGRPGPQLERMLEGGRPVYAMGNPGTALLDHAQALRMASQRLQVQDAVLLLEAYDARQALCGSGNVHSRCLDPDTLQPTVDRRQHADGFKRIARHSALAQYLVSQIKLRPAALWRSMFVRMPPEAMHRSPSSAQGTTSKIDPLALLQAQRVVDAAVAEFFRVLSAFPLRRLVVLVDGRRSGPATEPELIDLERQHLMMRLREGGAFVVDLEAWYARQAEQSPRSLDVGPYDGHLNALGVGVAMSAAAHALLMPTSLGRSHSKQEHQ